jgi:hypothetical protein
MIQSLRDGPVADDEAASGAPKHSLSGRSQTSHGRLAKTRQAVGEAGFAENSPAIHGWEPCNPNFKVPLGTAEDFLSSLTGLVWFVGRFTQP